MNPSRQLTLFTEDSLDPANPSPWLVTGKDGTTLGSCGLSFRGWSERLARVGLWLRTYLESLPLPPTTSARIWSVSAITSGFGILKLWLSGRRTGGRGCSLWRTWATPKAGDAIIGATARTSGRPLEKTTHLAAQVHLYPTPRAANGMTGALRKPENIRDTSRLEDFVAIFPTPTVCGNHNRKGASKTSQDGLATCVQKLLPTPTANDAKCNGTPSQQNRSSAALNVVAGGSLNPEWVEWLMGFPRGWTEVSGTESLKAYPEQPEASPTEWRG